LYEELHRHRRLPPRHYIRELLVRTTDSDPQVVTGDPYAQVLFGGVRASSSVLIQVPEGTVPPQIVVAPREGRSVTARATTAQTAFAWTPGGGVDIRINNYMRFRPIGLDWYMTRLQNLRTLEDKNQDNIRYTAGLNINWGAR
jgi:hypothetical protein